jgi:hypothetical protein
MKIILSRKGYDDQYGGKPSIIYPDGTMLSFPIPVYGNEEGTSSESLMFKGKSLSKIQNELGHKNVLQKHHIDPDIYHFDGKPGSIGAFGQSGASLGHLENQGVGKGDVFLFFGSFCRTFEVEDTLNYEPMHSFHAIFGFLEVEEKVKMQQIEYDEKYKWLRDHPHFENRNHESYFSNNAIYIGRNYGYFRFDEDLQLTKPGYKKSYWRLPHIFKDVKISYHEAVQKRIIDNNIEFVSAAKGQEFVFESNTQINQWLENILDHKIV